MYNKLNKISNFLEQHHVMSLASMNKNQISVCNLFYAYIRDMRIFIVASNEETLHIQHILKNQNIAGSVVLETKTIGKIQGLQFRGIFELLDNNNLKKEYFKKFPYALAMKPKLWQIKVDYFKLTDNRLGFGKKIIWQAKASS